MEDQNCFVEYEAKKGGVCLIRRIDFINMVGFFVGAQRLKLPRNRHCALKGFITRSIAYGGTPRALDALKGCPDTALGDSSEMYLAGAQLRAHAPQRNP